MLSSAKAVQRLGSVMGLTHTAVGMGSSTSQIRADRERLLRAHSVGDARSPEARTCCIVIVNWRRPAVTLNCVESLLQSKCRDFHIIVCDNGSADDSMAQFLQWARRQAPGIASPNACSSEDLNASGPPQYRVNWMAIANNLGFAGGANLGLQWGLIRRCFTHFWLLNNDSLVDTGALGALFAHMQRRPNVGICGARLLYLGDRKRVQALGGARFNRWTGRGWHLGHGAHAEAQHDPAEIERQMSYVCGASMFVSRRFVETVGLMESSYFLYFEELDWAQRAAGRFALGYEPDALVWHQEGATIGSSSEAGRSSAVSDYFMCRSALRFTLMFHPLALPSVWLTAFLRSLKAGCSGRVPQMLMQWRALFGLVRQPPDQWVSRHLGAAADEVRPLGRR